MLALGLVGYLAGVIGLLVGIVAMVALFRPSIGRGLLAIAVFVACGLVGYAIQQACNRWFDGGNESDQELFGSFTNFDHKK